jgi:predicted branched-subunit amino acid permease
LQRFRESGDVRANASYFLGSGALLWVVWQFATLAGILAGQVIPASWQLEFVVPLCFLAVLTPLLRDRVSLLVFAVAAIAVIVLDAMPLRLSMICSGLLGIMAGVIVDKMMGVRE